MTFRQHDPGDECSCTQHQLALNIPPQHRCKACGALAPNLCTHSADLAHGISTGRRPAACLVRVDPATTPWPTGY